MPEGNNNADLGYDKMRQAADDITRRVRLHGLDPDKVKDGIVLGSGLGGFAKEEMDFRNGEAQGTSGPLAVPFDDVFRAIHYSGAPLQSVPGHSNKLIIGPLKGAGEERLVIAQSGREHPYQGVDTRRATFWLRVMQLMGVETLISSNAAGILTPATLEPPKLMLLRSSQDLAGDANPLHGLHDERLGPLFLDRSGVYPEATRERVRAVAGRLGIPLAEGMYVRMAGPDYEGAATVYRLRALLKEIWEEGAIQPEENRFGGSPTGVVGMSTTYEATVAQHAVRSQSHPAFRGGRAFISVSTNYAASLGPEGVLPPLDHAHVKEMAAQVEGKFIPLVRETLLDLRGAT